MCDPSEGNAPKGFELVYRCEDTIEQVVWGFKICIITYSVWGNIPGVSGTSEAFAKESVAQSGVYSCTLALVEITPPMLSAVPFD